MEVVMQAGILESREEIKDGNELGEWQGGSVSW